ncbi:MAG TPA: methyltransferase domain-containing protein [Bacteroidales bacterium]|nr:methyltransferase domain-containing protein [Bacteroidales bacterium]
MYPEWLNEILRDPGTGDAIVFNGNGYVSGNKSYKLHNGILSLAWPEEIGGSDGSYNRFYNIFAPFYDLNERIFSRMLFGIDTIEGRKEIVRNLGLKKDIRLLEVSPGPGVFQRYLKEDIGENGELVALDLSMGMLRQCQKRNGDLNVCLIHGNAQFLPFADDSFDSLFHFGGINLFNDPGKAISEFVRVVRKGGTVSWGDEGISPNYKDERRKKIAQWINPGFIKTRPGIPSTVCDVKQFDVYGGLAYLVVAKKS